MSAIHPKLRNDLVVSRQDSPGGTIYVIKDPTAGRFFQFRAPEFFIVQQFDGRTETSEIRRRSEEKFGATVSENTLSQFTERLNRLGLLEREPSEPPQDRQRHRQGRVRGIHAYGEATDLARAGHSSAINLTDVDYREVHRGMVLTQPGYYRGAKMFEARLSYLASNKRPLAHQTSIRLHLGTAECLGKVYLLEKRSIQPGEEAFVIPALTPVLSLTGPPDEVRERCRALARAGVDNLALQAIPGQGRELIEEFGREVIGRL